MADNSKFETITLEEFKKRGYEVVDGSKPFPLEYPGKLYAYQVNFIDKKGIKSSVTVVSENDTEIDGYFGS